MLDLSAIDLEPIASALADQEDYEHYTLVNPDNGETVFWTEYGGLDGKTPVDLDEFDLIPIRPLPSRVWYEDMVDFAEQVSDSKARNALLGALDGRRAFRRFKDELHRRNPQLIQEWYAFRDARANRRAVEWLAEHELITEEAAERYLDEHPDPAIESEPERVIVHAPVLLDNDGHAVNFSSAFEAEGDAQKVLDHWRSEGRTDSMEIRAVTVYESFEEWRAAR